MKTQLAARLTGSASFQKQTLFGADENRRTGIIRADPTGDTYSLAPLVQDDATSTPLVYALTSPTESGLTFNSTPTNIGANFPGSSGGTFLVTSTFLPGGGTGPGIDRVEVSVKALNSSLQREPWVATGETGNSGATLITWRLDVGAFNASNTIMPNNSFVVADSGVEVYNIAGGLVLSGPLPPGLDLADGETLAGVVAFQFQIMGVPQNIAGFDIAEVVMFWAIEEILFADGFESGNTAAWQ